MRTPTTRSKLLMLCLVGLGMVGACASRSFGDASGEATQQKPVALPTAQRATGGAFQGRWKECGKLPDQHGNACDGYVLVQNRDNVCGTWEYSATYQMYSGQLQAKSTSGVLAKITLICGRPGAETSTECEDEYVRDGGWEPTDKKLAICKGQLSALDDQNGNCIPQHKKTKISQREMRALLSQPWMQTCLARP
jgi:hypothetical protein